MGLGPRFPHSKVPTSHYSDKSVQYSDVARFRRSIVVTNQSSNASIFRHASSFVNSIIPTKYLSLEVSESRDKLFCILCKNCPTHKREREKGGGGGYRKRERWHSALSECCNVGTTVLFAKSFVSVFRQRETDCQMTVLSEYRDI